MRPAVLGLLRLTRPANLPTAVADILAGVALAGIFRVPAGAGIALATPWWNTLYVVMASICLYAGGVVLNDVFDADLDRVERPERPIPVGTVSVRAAALFGSILLLLGVSLAFLVHPGTALIATLLLFFILLYDAYLKKFTIWGPLNMGVCRGLNLLMGMSVMGWVTQWWYGLIPLVYIFAITLISRGEVHGRNKKQLVWAAFLYALVIFSIIYIWASGPVKNITVPLYLGLFSYMVYMPLGSAYQINSAQNIKNAVLAGVLSLIILDASMAVIFAPWWFGLLILLLWLLSKALSKLFAVT